MCASTHQCQFVAAVRINWSSTITGMQERTDRWREKGVDWRTLRQTPLLATKVIIASRAHMQHQQHCNNCTLQVALRSVTTTTDARPLIVGQKRVTTLTRFASWGMSAVPLVQINYCTESCAWINRQFLLGIHMIWMRPKHQWMNQAV